MSKDWNAWDSWWLANYHRGTYDSTSSDGARASDVLSALEACGVPAPTGRKVAAVIYEDELPEVTEDPAYLHVNGLNYGDRSPTWRKSNLAEARKEFQAQLALLRHIEAREAAAKEREREVAQLADQWTEFFRTRADPEPDAAYPQALAEAGVPVPQGEGADDELAAEIDRAEAAAERERGTCTEGCHADPIDRGLEAG